MIDRLDFAPSGESVPFDFGNPALVQQAIERDPYALGRLFDTTFNTIYSEAFRVADNEAGAERLTGAVFQALSLKLPQLDYTADLEEIIVGIVNQEFEQLARSA